MNGIKVLIDLFYQELENRLGEKPAGFKGGAAGRGFKNLLKSYPEAEIRRRIKFWFESTDAFICKRSWRVEDFLFNFNALKNGPILEFPFRKEVKHVGAAAPVPNKYGN